MHITVLLYVILFFAALLAGLVDSIAGGGGLITIPVLLSAGFPPHMALGTNKFQASFGSFTSSYNYVKQADLDLRLAFPGIIFTAIGAGLGALVVQFVHAEVLELLIPILLIAILIYTILSPNLGKHETTATMNRRVFYLVFGFGIGFYDGFFGPGTGSFWPVAFVLALGYNLVKATGYTKVMNFTSNIISLIVFWIGGKIFFLPGIVMAVGQAIGARIGTKLVIDRGVAFIRPVFIAVVLATTLKLFYDYFK